MSNQIRLIHKINMSLIVVGSLIFGACGSSSDSADSKEWSEKQTCETVNTIRNDISQASSDFVNGKVDFGESLVSIAMIQTRIEIVQDSAPEGDLKAAIDRWALSRQRIIDNTSENAQLTEENDVENKAAADALDKMCA